MALQLMHAGVADTGAANKDTTTRPLQVICRRSRRKAFDETRISLWQTRRGATTGGFSSLPHDQTTSGLENTTQWKVRELPQLRRQPSERWRMYTPSTRYAYIG